MLEEKYKNYGIDIEKAKKEASKQISCLTDQKEYTKPFEVKKVLKNSFGIEYNLPTKYIGYNSEYDKINDDGWGCAWRSIQMLLSSFQDNPEPFNQLFYKFGTKEFIKSAYLIQNNTQICPGYIQNWNNSPVQLENGWAEPFVCFYILNYYKKQCRLFKVNDYDIDMYAPQECFSNIVDSWEFINILLEHFTIGNQTPAMIDDGIQAKVILFARYIQNGEIEIIIGDPHINQQSEEIKQNTYTGVYRSIYNENGKFLYKDLKKEQYEYYCINPQNTHDCFETLSWMVCMMI